jgi:peptide/nickel transport system substrate-binding protein
MVPNLYRRQVLNRGGGAAATGAVASIGGCLDGGNERDGTSGQSGNGDTEVVYRQYGNRNLSEIQYNFQSVSRPAHRFGDLLGSRFMYRDKLTGEITPYLAEDISIEDATLTVSLSEEFVWENGNSVTADDLETQLKLGVIMENFPRVGLLGDLIDETTDVTKTDEYTVSVDLNQDVGEALTIPNAFTGGGTGGPILWTPESVFGGYVEDYEDATTDDARTSVQDEVLQFRWELDDVISNGMATLEDKNQTVVLLTPHEGHPDSDNIPWDTLEHYYLSGQDRILQAARSGELDFVSGSFQADVLPDDGWQKMHFTEFSGGGAAVICNHADEILGQTEVKQAIAHIADRDQIASINPLNLAAPDHLTMGESIVNQYYTGELTQSMIRYGSRDRAAELLESADFERNDGLWYKPDGEQFTVEIHCPSAAWTRDPARSVASSMTEFGIETEVIAQGGGTFFPNYSEGSYRMVVEYAASGNGGVFSGFKRNMYGFDGAMNYPETVEAPPVSDPDGDLVTHEVRSLVDSMLTYDSKDELDPVVRKLAWAQNYTLPVIPLIYGSSRVFANTSRWEWPAPDDNAWHYAQAHNRMSLTGKITPK